ncbi:MAG: Minf_1886 family protein [Planctomycetota bacterium]
MPMDMELAEKFEDAVRRDGRYPPEAYEFLHRGLELATRMKHGAPPAGSTASLQRHVTGQELCDALRVLAIRQWGPLAREVLRRWNIHRTRDFGQMVYLMIDVGLMGKQDSDEISDFDDVYDFAVAFGGYEIPLDQVPLEGDAE